MIWHVIFHPSEGEWWAGRFRHVSLAGFDDDTWVNLDLDRSGVRVTPIYRHDDVQDYLTTLLHYYTVLRFGPSIGKQTHFLRPMTCVSFVRHTLGARSSALRPDGLFRDLRRNHGAEVLNEGVEGHRKP